MLEVLRRSLCGIEVGEDNIGYVLYRVWVERGSAISSMAPHEHIEQCHMNGF